MEYYATFKRNKFESGTNSEVDDLELVIQSEVSQKRENKYHILTYIDIYGT